MTNDNVIAIIQYGGGKKREIRQTYDGGLYLAWVNYDGLFAAGATASNSAMRMGILQSEIKDGGAVILQSRFTLYHCWHVCFCADCARFGGRAWDHSQGLFNEHLRYTSSDELFTFPSGKPLE